MLMFKRVFSIFMALLLTSLLSSMSLLAANDANVVETDANVVADCCSAEIDTNGAEDTEAVVFSTDNTNCPYGCGLFFSEILGHCVPSVCIEYCAAHGKTCLCYLR
jgi:hypothetical protein